MSFLLMAAALFLVFGNGANDNFKGFATVWGSDTLSYRKALLLAAAATAAGSLLALSLAAGLAPQFSGRGLLPQAIVSAPVFLTSVGLGAALTVLVATRAGLPVSTTHALIGGLVGAGLAASPGEVQFARLGQSFVLPLLASPIAAAVLGLAAVRLLRLRPAAQDCVCLAAAPLPAAAGAGAVHASVALPRIIVEEAQVCARQPLASRRWSVAQALDRLHVGTATLICFARAVNDTPKLAALLLAAQVMPPRWSSVLIATVMVAGGLLFARRVAETMSKRVTRMDHTQGVAANLITSALVLAASLFALPVSTTHVAVGAIAGVGAANGLQWETLRNVLLSWIATLPLAALLAEAAFQVLGALA